MDAALLQNLRQVTEEEKAILAGDKQVRKDLYATGGGFTINKSKVLPQGRQIHIRTHTRFVDFPAHRHDYVEMLYMCSGETVHTIEGGLPLVLKAGEILLLNQHCSHAVQAAGEGDIGVNFIIMPAFFHTAFDMMDSENLLSDFILDSLMQGDARPQYLHFRVADLLPVQNLMENLIWSLSRSDDSAQRLDGLTMGLLFQHLLSSIERADEGSPQLFKSRLVQKAVRYIDGNYADATLEAFAQKNGQSIYEMSRSIKRETGASFKELLQIKRFTVALRLLRTTRLSVNDVINAVGYTNTSYFHRQFRAKYGMSPAEYRKAYPAADMVE